MKIRHSAEQIIRILKEVHLSYSHHTFPMTRLRFEDKIGIHFSLYDVTQTGCHVIDCRLKTKVPEIARKWPEKIMGSNYFHSDDGSLDVEQLVLRFSDTCTVTLDSRYISWGSDCLVVSKSREEALFAHKHLTEVFGIPETSRNRDRAAFMILALEDKRIISHRIELAQVPELTPEIMELGYGMGFAEWAQNLAEIFKNKPSSLILLQGPPRTGKTSFLRWLIGQNQDNADFYFIPITSISLLANPNLTSFWLSECR